MMILISNTKADLDQLRATIDAQVGSSDAVQENLLDPMINGADMKTIDAQTTFSTQEICKNSEVVLDVVAFPSPTGDITLLNIQQDTDWDGKLDKVNQIMTPISGVCANGIISCKPGTWENCQSYNWYLSPDNSISLVAVPMAKVGGCYCINQSCGQSLMLNNASEVLSHIGGGIVAVLGASHPTLIVSNSYAKDTQIKYLGGLSDSCKVDGVSNQASFFNSPATLEQTAKNTSTLDTMFQTITTGAAATDTSMTTHSCSINRNINIDEATAQQVVLYNSGAGAVKSCGAGCLDIVLGTIGDDYWVGGSCGLFEHTVNFWVARPERILSATLMQAKFDDHIQISSNDNFIWSHEAGWSDLSDLSYPPSTTWPNGQPYCERFTSWNVYPNIDFTSAIKVQGAHEFSIRVAVSDKGEGYAYARLFIDESCALEPDSIQDTCTVYTNDTDCSLEWESVDGITTIDNYMLTGLTPLPTTKTINGQNCALPADRPWWNRKRTYKCKSNSSYDFTGILDRKSTVSGSASLTGYDDLRLNEQSNTWESHTNIGMQYPTPPVVPTCENTCKTQQALEADEVAGMGPETSQWTQTNTQQVNYRTCTHDNECPLAPGEVLVSPCACQSHFMDAALLMQSGRLAGKEAVCTSGVPSPL